MSDENMGFAIGDEVEVCDYKYDPRRNGVVFTIDRIIHGIAYETKPFKKYSDNGWSGAMYLTNLRRTSRPEDFICDI